MAPKQECCDHAEDDDHVTYEHNLQEDASSDTITAPSKTTSAAETSIEKATTKKVTNKEDKNNKNKNHDSKKSSKHEQESHDNDDNQRRQRNSCENSKARQTPNRENQKNKKSVSSASKSNGNSGNPSSSSSSSSVSSSSSSSSSKCLIENQTNKKLSSKEILQMFVPLYLRPYVFPCHGDFCYTLCFHPTFVAQLMSEGFLPIATDDRVLLPKLHQKRSVISLVNENNTCSTNNNSSNVCGDLHIRKSVRKKCKRFDLSINQCFDEVIDGCHKQHGHHCWLYPQLVEAFRYMYEMTNSKHDGIYLPRIDDDNYTMANTPKLAMKNRNSHIIVRFYTIQVWNSNTGKLAGGEIGYTVGDIYTSLTGFSCEDSAGSVQLLALGKLLKDNGFKLWDLGMEMDYKSDLGSRMMPREQFVAHVHNSRSLYPFVKLSINPNRLSQSKESESNQLSQEQQSQSTSSHEIEANRRNAKQILDGDMTAKATNKKQNENTGVKKKSTKKIKSSLNRSHDSNIELSKKKTSTDCGKSVVQDIELVNTKTVVGLNHKRSSSSSPCKDSDGQEGEATIDDKKVQTQQEQSSPLPSAVARTRRQAKKNRSAS